MSGLLSALAIQLAGTGGGTTPTPDPRPTPADATIAAMRPTGRRIGLLTVGAGRDHATLGAAISAATAIQSARMSAEGATALTPNYRVDVLVYKSAATATAAYPAGHYDEVITAGPFVSFYAAEPDVWLCHTNPAGVNTTDLSVLSTNGYAWWEGINILLLKPPGEEGNWAKYCIHVYGKGTNVFAACDLVVGHTAAGGSSYTPIGMDGYGGSSTPGQVPHGGLTVLYRVDMGPTTGVTAGPTNMHGALGSGAVVGETLVYALCTSPSTLNYASLAANDGVPNHMWVDRCTAPSVSLTGTASTLHLSGSTISGSVTAPTQDTRSDWPVPTGGLSATDRAYFGMGPHAALTRLA